MTTANLSGVRALIFDLDGTLIDSKQDLIHSVNAMLREMRRAELPEATIASYIGHGAPQLVARAMGTHSSDSECSRALEFFLAYYEDHKLDATCAYPGVPEALEELRTLPMAVLTNKPVRISVRILDALGLSTFFRLVYGGNSFETKKPHPLGARTIMHELSISGMQGLMIGDSEVDIQTARNAGMLAAVASYGFGIYDRQACPADLYLDTLKDLPPALGIQRKSGS